LLVEAAHVLQTGINEIVAGRARGEASERVLGRVVLLGDAAHQLGHLAGRCHMFVLSFIFNV